MRNLNLINADNNSTIKTLVNGDILSFEDFDNNGFNIEAVTTDSRVKSVKFTLFHASGSETQVENFSPYSLFGDNGGNFHSWSPKAGEYTLNVKTYSESGSKGDQLEEHVYKFSFIGTDSDKPNPGGIVTPVSPVVNAEFNQSTDLISLHFDHAPDTDDGHSAAADRMILETDYGCEWIEQHTVVVSGAYGKNKNTFRESSDRVMDAAFNECGGWIDAHNNHPQAAEELYRLWLSTIDAGGHVWVKEGGQSDITARVVRLIRSRRPEVPTHLVIHVYQHSNFNERETSEGELDYVRTNTHYTRLRDANGYLNSNCCGLKEEAFKFKDAVLADPKFGPIWEVAFDYKRQGVDFSDTGELLHILGLGELSFKEIREKYLQ